MDIRKLKTLLLIRSRVKGIRSLAKKQRYSTSTIHKWAKQLKEEGFINYLFGKDNSVSLTKKGEIFLRDYAIIYEDEKVTVGRVELV